MPVPFYFHLVKLMYIARLQIDAWDQIYDAEKFLIVSST